MGLSRFSSAAVAVRPDNDTPPPPLDISGRTAALVHNSRPADQKMPAGARAVAMEKMRFCQAVVEHARAGQVSERTAAAAVAALSANDYPQLKKAGHGGKSALNYSNFVSWIRKAGRRPDRRPDPKGLNNLAPAYYDVKNNRAGSDAWWELFNRMYYNDERLEISRAYRLATDCAAGHGIDDIPAEHQVRYWLKRYGRKDAEMMARMGATDFENKVAGFVRREWSAIDPGYCWVGDHHQLDIYVKVYDQEKDGYVVKRPWLTAWMDIRSLYFVGWTLSTDYPGSLAIIQALAIGICAADFQAPAVLYSDNGKDFKRKGLAEPVEFDGEKHWILGDLGVQPKLSLPYSGRSKPIERMFREICRNFCKMFPTYLGSNIQERPETAGYFESNPEDAPGMPEVQELFKEYIYTEYHVKPQNGRIIGRGIDGKTTPDEMWARRSVCGTQWTDMDALRAAFRLPMTQTRKVGNGFCIRIHKEDYREAGGGTSALATHFGRDIMVKQDVLSGDEIWHAYDTKGRWICELEKVPGVHALLAAYDPDEKELLAAELRRQRRIRADAVTVIREATGLPVIVSALDAIRLMTPGAELELAGSRKSIKGSTHAFRHYRVSTPGDREAQTIEAAETAAITPVVETIAEPEKPAVDQEAIDRLRALKAKQAENQY